MRLRLPGESFCMALFKALAAFIFSISSSVMTAPANAGANFWESLFCAISIKTPTIAAWKGSNSAYPCTEKVDNAK